LLSSLKKVPFNFILDELYPLHPQLKPMFGCYAVYAGKKIVLILRKQKSHPSINGVWIATKKEHHESLKKIFPSMKSIHVLGKGVTNWQVIQEKAEDFESSVLTACEMILKGDKRIGTIPKVKSKVKIKNEKRERV
jgi:hypothetical protein